LIYGRYDYTDRFYYWLYKVKTQDKILIPDSGKDKFSATYSEDFAKLIKSAITVEHHNKVYNASTHAPVSVKQYLDSASRLMDKKPQYISASPEFLEANKVTPWLDLPVWIGGMDLMVDNSKAIKDFNIEFNSFDDSLKGCIDYYLTLGWKAPVYGLVPEKEQELIKKLK
jgi:2'-hydroxyisoflavone reductase